MSKTFKVKTDGNGALTNTAIQKAVDTANMSGGGVVEVPAGTYRMRDSLHLKSNVTVLGEAGTVLLKEPSVQTPLLDYLGYGHYEFTVTDPDCLDVGMGVLIADDNGFGFYTTIATIVARKDDRFFINRPLSHDYNPGKNATVSTLFPIVSVVEADNVRIADLTVDGNVEETRIVNGCRAAGVYMLQARTVTIENVEVANFKGDAVSFQQCADVTVSDCRLHNNSGGGLHPGSGSVRYVMQNNRIHDNGGCGIFYCLRTTHSICKGNHVERNGQAGISIGERDTDHFITGNQIKENGREGIVFRDPLVHGGDRVLIEDNRFIGNGHGLDADDAAEIAIPAGLEDVMIRRNSFDTKRHALYLAAGSQRVVFAGNKINSRPQTSDDISGDRASVSYEPDSAFPCIDPDSLPSDGALHLGMKWLAPFRRPC